VHDSREHVTPAAEQLAGTCQLPSDLMRFSVPQSALTAMAELMET